ncbi:MAG: hypothetical protein EXS33_04370 [Pedosphaera sp.]|nr:hypothetical protein [Pedosphaera sp.]
MFTDDDCLPASSFLPAYRAAMLEAKAQGLEGRTESCGEKLAADFECPDNRTGGFLWSCNFAILRPLFLELGGFDPLLTGAAMEDVEFNWRLEDRREPVQFVPEALVHHPWRRRKGWPFPRVKARSVAYCVKKHPARATSFPWRRMAGIWPGCSPTICPEKFGPGAAGEFFECWPWNFSPPFWPGNISVIEAREIE